MPANQARIALFSASIFQKLAAARARRRVCGTPLLMKPNSEEGDLIRQLTGKVLLIVHPGSPGKRFVLERLRACGLRLVLLHDSPGWAADFFDAVIPADPKNIPAAVAAVRTWLAADPARRIDGVFCYWEESLFLASAVADALRLPGVPYSVIDHAKNKYRFRQLCRAAGIATPGFALVNRSAEIARAQENLKFPVVVKPIWGAASGFVQKVETPADLPRVVADIQSRIDAFWLAPDWQNLDLMAEEYIPGDEVDINLLVHGGEIRFQMIEDNAPTAEPYFVETGFTAPSRLPEPALVALADMARGIVAATGAFDGCFQLEAKWTGERAVPLEINLRMGGDEAYPFSLAVYGVDLLVNAAAIAVGLPIPDYRDWPARAHVAGLDIFSEHAGRVTAIEIDPAVAADPRLVMLRLAKEVGDTIHLPPEDFDYLGWVACQADSPEPADRHLAELARGVRVQVDPFDS